MRARFALSLFSVFIGSFVAGACSDETTATPAGSTTSSSGSSPAISADSCKARCGVRATACDAPAGTGDALCAQLCAGSVTEGQASCLERKACSELIDAAAKSESLDTICPASASSSSSSSGSSSSTTSSSGSSTPDIPATLTITATIPSGYKVQHTKSDNQIASLFNVAPEPTFEPERPNGQFPNLFDAKEADVTVDSPPRNGCTSKFTFTVNAMQISVQTIGVDTLPETACATWTDKMAADGVKLTVKNVAWANSTKTSTVKIELK